MYLRDGSAQTGRSEIDVANLTFYLTQSQCTDTGSTSPSSDPMTPGAWQGSHWSANVEVTGMTRPGTIPSQAGIKPWVCRSRGGHLNHWAIEEVCNGPRVMQRRDRQKKKKNSTSNLTTVRVHVSGVFTQRTQISPLTLDVTTNRYFIVQRGTPNIF